MLKNRIKYGITIIQLTCIYFFKIQSFFWHWHNHLSLKSWRAYAFPAGNLYIYNWAIFSERLFNPASSSTPVIPLYTPLVSHFSNALTFNFQLICTFKFIFELSRLECRYHYPSPLDTMNSQFLCILLPALWFFLRH